MKPQVLQNKWVRNNLQIYLQIYNIYRFNFFWRNSFDKYQGMTIVRKIDTGQTLLQNQIP